MGSLANHDMIGGLRNPDYTSTFVFDNDYAALLLDEGPCTAFSPPSAYLHPRKRTLPRVCFSPRHDLTLPEPDQAAMEKVISTWTQQIVDRSQNSFVQYVQVFENKGAMMGCSNPHPHSQIWATEHIPVEPAKELERLRNYFSANGQTLLSDYLAEEYERQERILFANGHFSALVPYWTVWPFESIVIAHRNVTYLDELPPAGVSALADIMKRLTTRYDNIFEILLSVNRV
jgi:UDPglucose--hexose-1-phosphate uridylyltransferase